MANEVLKFPIARRRATPNALLAEYVPMLRREWPSHVTEAVKELKSARRKWFTAMRKYERARARAAEPRKRIRRCKGEDARVINLNFARWQLQEAHKNLRFAREMLGEWVELRHNQPWVYGDEGAVWESAAT